MQGRLSLWPAAAHGAGFELRNPLTFGPFHTTPTPTSETRQKWHVLPAAIDPDAIVPGSQEMDKEVIEEELRIGL